MDANELRALADALDDCDPPYYESSPQINRSLDACIAKAAAYLRAQADAQPVPAAPQAEPKREPLSDEQIDAALQTDPVLITRLMIGSMTVSEFRAALRRLARIVERALEIGGSDAE